MHCLLEQQPLVQLPQPVLLPQDPAVVSQLRPCSAQFWQVTPLRPQEASDGVMH